MQTLSVVISDSRDVLKHKRILPCGCVLHWDLRETLIAFCVGHTFDYMKWNGKDEEFIKIVINTQREIRYLDESVLATMR